MRKEGSRQGKQLLRVGTGTLRHFDFYLLDFAAACIEDDDPHTIGLNDLVTTWDAAESL